MTSPLLAAGTSCGGPPDHSHRAWCVDAERYLLVGGETSPALTYGLATCPIPGDARVLIVDPFRFITLLDTGAAFRLDVQHGRPKYRLVGKENTVKTKDNAPLLAGAWPICGGNGFVLLDNARRIWTWSPAGRSELAPLPIPGDGRIVGIDATSRTVIFDSGERLVWLGGGWARLPGLLDATTSGLLRVRCERGFCLGAAGDLSPGDEVDMPEVEARRHLREGRVSIVPVSDAVA